MSFPDIAQIAFLQACSRLLVELAEVCFDFLYVIGGVQANCWQTVYHGNVCPSNFVQFLS